MITFLAQDPFSDFIVRSLKRCKAMRLYCSTLHFLNTWVLRVYPMFVLWGLNQILMIRGRFQIQMGGRSVVEKRGRDNYRDCPAFESPDCPIPTNRTLATTSRSGEPFSPRVTWQLRPQQGCKSIFHIKSLYCNEAGRKFLGIYCSLLRLETLKYLSCKGLNLLSPSFQSLCSSILTLVSTWCDSIGMGALRQSHHPVWGSWQHMWPKHVPVFHISQSYMCLAK